MGSHLSAALSVVNSAALQHAISVTLCNGGMRTVEEVRRLRLAQLLAEKGSYAALNELIGRRRTDSTFSQIAAQSQGSKSSAPKQMGSSMARTLERELSKPHGWMDTDPELESNVWPFGEDLPPAAIAALPPAFLDKAKGLLQGYLALAEQDANESHSKRDGTNG